MTPNRLRYCLLACLLSFCAMGSVSSAQTNAAKPVSGCELLRHPKRYNRKMVIVEGRHTWGFERSDLTFGCSGSIAIQLSLNPGDLEKYGFLTEQSTLDAMSQLPPGEQPGDNLTTRKLRYAPVTVVGLFRCHYDFATCKNASREDGSIVVKSMQFKAPFSEVPPTKRETRANGIFPDVMTARLAMTSTSVKALWRRQRKCLRHHQLQRQHPEPDVHV